MKMLLGRFACGVRLVWRNFPLEEVRPHALDAAPGRGSGGGAGVRSFLNGVIADVSFGREHFFDRVGAELRAR